MENISEYWYTYKELPKNFKDELKIMVTGTPIEQIRINNKNVNLLKVDGSTFSKVFANIRNYLYKGDYTAPPEENDYIESLNYLTEDGRAGFSVTSDGWLVSLFSSYDKGGFAKAVKKYIIGNAYKLVCIVTNEDEKSGLLGLYKNLFGFRIYARTIDDEIIMRQYYGDLFMDKFISSHGKPFHVFMIGENASGFNNSTKSFNNYFEAEKYVNDTVSLKSKK